jgi:ADP-heptose:LPS heptosyltransferase
MKIIVALIEHIGDIIACEPVSRYLRTNYPSSNIAWAVLEQYRELIDRNPHVDQTIVVECLTEWMRLVKHRAYDLVVDLHVNFRECPHCKIPLYKTTGNRDVNAYEWFDYGSILEAFSLGAGLPKLADHPKIYIGDVEKAFVDNLHLGENYSVIHRAPNENSKDWRDDRWAQVIDYLIQDLGLRVIEVGKTVLKEQYEASRDLQRKHGDMYVDLVDKTTILGVAEVIRRSRLFLGIDSGPAHMANASFTPGVVLLGRIGNFRRYTPFSGYYASDSEHVKLVRNLAGPARDIPAARVIEAVKHVIATGREKPSVTGGLPYDREGGTRCGTRKSSSHAFSVASHAIPALEPGDLTRADATVYPRVFAFYFPQVYPTSPNNDSRRMEAFEWQTITDARPLFRGHYQPRAAGELGFYECRSLDVIRQQVELARAHGVTGFCFAFHDSNGGRLSCELIESYVKSDIKAPFCLLLRNEDSSESGNGAIIRQQHSAEDDRVFIERLLPVFRDDRYLKVDGKPVLLVHKPHLFSNVRESTERWRTEMEKARFNGIYLVMADDGNTEPTHPRALGFDACYEVPSHVIPPNVTVGERDAPDFFDKFHGRIVDYYKFANFHLSRPLPRYKRFRTVMPPWDDTPLRTNKATIHVNTENDSYRLWLTEAYIQTFERFSKDERIVFIHSWNHWCDGTYLEPDGRRERRYLEETRDAMDLGRKVIELYENAAVAVSSATLLARIDREKEEGAFRMSETATATIRDMRRELAHANAAARAMEEALYQSTSWRVTAPLRMIARLFGKGVWPLRKG